MHAAYSPLTRCLIDKVKQACSSEQFLPAVLSFTPWLGTAHSGTTAISGGLLTGSTHHLGCGHLLGFPDWIGRGDQLCTPVVCMVLLRLRKDCLVMPGTVI